jgi:hypothetical protein
MLCKAGVCTKECTDPCFVAWDSCLQSVRDIFIAIFRSCVPEQRLALVLRTWREEGAARETLRGGSGGQGEALRLMPIGADTSAVGAINRPLQWAGVGVPWHHRPLRVSGVFRLCA